MVLSPHPERCPAREGTHQYTANGEPALTSGSFLKPRLPAKNTPSTCCHLGCTMFQAKRLQRERERKVRSESKVRLRCASITCSGKLNVTFPASQKLGRSGHRDNSLENYSRTLGQSKPYLVV